MIYQCSKKEGDTVLPGLPLGIDHSVATGELIFGYSLKPFNHAEHCAHRNQADSGKDHPSLPDRAGVIDEGTDPEEQVAYGSRSEPETLAETLEMARGNLGYERESERRDKEFGYGEEEIKENQHPGAGLHPLAGGNGHIAECLARRIFVECADHCQEYISDCSQTHADGDFAGSGNYFASACESREEPHYDGCEQNYKTGVEGLPYLRCDGIGLHEVAGEE